MYEFAERPRAREDDPETTRAKAEASKRPRELALLDGWQQGRRYYPQGDSVRYIMAKAAEERRLTAGDITGPDDALQWLAEHTITHVYDGE
jgi:hypothetical protein